LLNWLSNGLVVLGVLTIIVAVNAAIGHFSTKRHPPIGRLVIVDGVYLHYVDRGAKDAVPLVIFHGNGGLLQDMTISGLVDAAAEHYRVICFDRPGFGHSSRPRFRTWPPEQQAHLFAEALKELDAKSPVVLGHSWGALVALAMAARDMSSVRGLVLVSGYYFPTFRLDVLLASAPAIPIVGDLMRYTISPLFGSLMLPTLLRKIFSPRGVPSIVTEQLPKALLVRPGQLRAAAEESASMIPAAASLAETYSNIGCPVAIIAGSEDALVNPGQAARLHATLPRSILATMPGLGHMVHHDAPLSVVQAVQAVEAAARPA
jgi:pimeloyl-ACP methyl ester carboxylesterase